ncbi:MAG: chromosome segregation protein SMC [Acidimicrobiales bacterium]
MFLKSLTLKGFKSFASPTTLEFEPGVTVVVGPNGSGKSNVVDAVAWVLGAQGPRTVRSSKMEDVIFAGTPSRPALGRAEVSLTIDNTAGLLAIEFSEVTITRTLFRSGESEYAINAVPCRLLDIQELLSDSGVGRQQHVIVSQGNLDSILNARPEDRRLVIEEAAGVLKFRRRKERSERRLESTEASMVRLQDLLREVRRQLRPLERQAEAARRHEGLVAELTAVRRYLMAGELAGVEGRLAAASRDRADLSGAERQLRGALAELDSEILAAEAQPPAGPGAGGVDLVELVSRGEGLRARAGGLAALLAERLRSTEQALAGAVDHDVVASLEAEAAALAKRLSATDDEASRLLPEADALAEAELVLAAEVAEVDRRWGTEDSQDAGGQQRLGLVLVDPAAEVRGELGALRSTVERDRAELERSRARVGSLEQRAGRLAGEVDRLGDVVGACDGARAGLAEAQEAAYASERSAEEALSRASDLRRSAEAEHHRWSARAEALAQALDNARAAAGAERLAPVAGVVGTLMELVEIDAGFEVAFEAAVGEVLSAVIVDGPDSARRGLEELHRLAAGGSLVALPEPAGGAATAGPVAPGAPGAIRTEALRDKVGARLPGVVALLDSLLAPAVVAGDWHDALDLAMERPDLVVVTRDGHRFARGLLRAGAGRGGATGAALAEARAKVDLAGHAVASAEAAARGAGEDLEVARAGSVAAERAAELNDSRVATASEGRRRAESELAEARSEVAVAIDHRQQLAGRLERDRARLEELETLLPSLEQEGAAEAERVAAERIARARLSERSTAVAEQRRQLEVKAAGLDERRDLTRHRLTEVEQRLHRLAAERDGAVPRRAGLVRVLSITGRLLAVVRDRESEVEGALDRLRQARRAESDAARQHSERLDGLRRQRTTAERQVAEVRERQNRVELQATEARVRAETLAETVRRDLDCDPEALRGAECPPLPPGTSPTSRGAELERELRMMGPINPLALEEHTALVERHQFLESQLEDVRNARRELAKVIRAIDAEIVEVFRAAYADVSENFEVLFATLFPGGQGRLRLTDPDHLLDTGIEIEARPSGKNVRRLSLLSGGERSLTAMAFLFAVFRSRPSPFYLMDEVEAALDDVNLHRFLDLLREFRSEAQLLVVSHQKRTMEAADCLYGVTMAPNGSSRVVSERAVTIAG